MAKSAEEIARNLHPNLRTLANQLARKPKLFTPQWAKSVTDSFTLYTRTSTVNYFLSLNEMLREGGWPFPVYLDLEREMEQVSRIKLGIFYVLIRGFLGNLPLSIFLLYFCIGKPEKESKTCIDRYFCKRFSGIAEKMFNSWQAHPLLQKKNKVLSDVYLSYKKHLWGVCIPSMIPLLDFLMRDYFHSNDLRDSVGILVKAFKLAGITAESLRPGYGIWDSLKKNPNEFMVADKVDKDLRLPGIYLASFVYFAQRYYSWHTLDTGSKELNRHAVVHGDTDYWSEVDTTKFLMFFDLTLKLEPVLRIIISD